MISVVMLGLSVMEGQGGSSFSAYASMSYLFPTGQLPGDSWSFHVDWSIRVARKSII